MIDIMLGDLGILSFNKCVTSGLLEAWSVRLEAAFCVPNTIDTSSQVPTQLVIYSYAGSLHPTIYLCSYSRVPFVFPVQISLVIGEEETA